MEMAAKYNCSIFFLNHIECLLLDHNQNCVRVFGKTCMILPYPVPNDDSLKTWRFIFLWVIRLRSSAVLTLMAEIIKMIPSNMFGFVPGLWTIFYDLFNCLWKVSNFLCQEAEFAAIWYIWMEYSSHIF